MKTHSDQDTTTRSTTNANQSFLSGKNGNENSFFTPQVVNVQPPTFFTQNSVIQRQPAKENDNSISIAEAKKIILKATKGWGTDESAIYDAIRRCDNHKGLMYDGEVINALNNDMSGHELWKSYLLIEYGNESKLLRHRFHRCSQIFKNLL